MTDTLEAVTRAICCPGGCFRPTHCVKYAHGGKEKARAALEAVLADMAEPSMAMLAAGYEWIDYEQGGVHGAIWQAMLAQYRKENLT